MEDFCLKYPWGVKIEEDVKDASARMIQAVEFGNIIYLCGNGGSFADCLHISGELKKAFERKRTIPLEHETAFKSSQYCDLLLNLEPAFPVRVLGNNPVLQTAFLNDVKVPELYFAQDLYGQGKKGDILFGISTSGNSKNICAAVELAKILEMKTIALTNQEGGQLAELADLTIFAPVKGTAAEIQEFHLPIYHLICRLVENFFYHDKR